MSVSAVESNREMPYVEGVRHRYVNANGLLMHVAEAGEGDPVLMLHGWPENWYMWRHVIPVLAKQYRVICPDLRGFGWTEAPPGGYQKEQFATDVLALMDEMGLEHVRLIGHDWGGWTGFLMCLREPDRFEAYLALNITHPWLRIAPALRNIRRTWYMATMASGVGGVALRLAPGAVKRRVRRALVNQSAWTDEDLDVLVGTLSSNARARASVQTYRSLFLRDGPDILLRGRYRHQRLTVPTVLMFGQQDVAIGVDMLDGFEEHSDNMSVEQVPDAGHFIVDEKPALVAERALRFFAAIDAAAAASQTDSAAPALAQVAATNT